MLVNGIDKHHVADNDNQLDNIVETDVNQLYHKISINFSAQLSSNIDDMDAVTEILKELANLRSILVRSNLVRKTVHNADINQNWTGPLLLSSIKVYLF